MGYNGSYFGLILWVYRGDDVMVIVSNNLFADIMVYWYGLFVPG
ncbi:copper oxidase, partial [Staphylococcus warneri]